MAVPDDPVAARVARNDAMFRAVNERVRSVAGVDPGDPIPLLCECADLRCTNVVLVTAQEYEEVRSHPARFLNDHGHVVNAEGWGRVVAENERFATVEKIGEAGEIAAELDTREATGT